MNTSIGRFWRYGLLLLILLGSLVFWLARPPLAQDPEFHEFVDQRALLGIPNFLNVTSNLPFLLVGVAGIWLYLRKRFEGSGPLWCVFFAGVALVSIGSGYYHWRPDNDTLVWDRLPMTIAFMAMFVALLSEFVNKKLGKLLLAPALIVGFSSVIYWHWSDDLRFYRWVQWVPQLTIPLVVTLFKTPFSHRSWLLLALGCYVLAKVSESHDALIFEFTKGTFGGHAVKHLLAATCCWFVLDMLKRRKAIEPRTAL